MNGNRKRLRSLEDGSAAVKAADIDNPNLDVDNPSKKARKETNASARRSLFVRSLPTTATTSDLTELFSQNYPLKHATVVLDPETKQSKGYGFVTFADADDAKRAMEEFNGQSFKGKKMKIDVAEPRSREPAPKDVAMGKKKSALSVEAAAAKKARAEKMAEARRPPKLIVRNIPWSINTPEKLAEMFIKFGKVKSAVLPKNNGTQAGFGFIVMRGKKNAERALTEVNGNLVDGRTLAVDWAVEKDVWEGQKTSGRKEDAEEDGTDEATEDEETPGGAPLIEDVQKDSEDVDDDVANFMKNFGQELESEDEDDDDNMDQEHLGDSEDEIASEEDDESGEEEEEVEGKEHNEQSEKAVKMKAPRITDNSTTLFVRNLPFTCLDPDLREHFMQFGPVRYARVVMDHATQRPKGTGFVCFYNVEDANKCFRGAPRAQPTGANAIKANNSALQTRPSVLQDEKADASGSYTFEGRVLQVSQAVEREQAVKLTEEGTNFRTHRDMDKRKLYLLNEGTVAAGTPLYEMLAPSEIKMREDSAKQRKKLIQNNPTLHLSLTRLSIRNLPRNINSKDLKALAREAVVGFAKDVKERKRTQLSKEEEARGGDEMRDAEKQRKAKGKGIVRQAKIVFEGREGSKVTEESGAGRSRGYGFIEYSSHRWALMGLRWLNGHALQSGSGKKQRLIVEFAIENAQVVQRRKEREEKARTRSKEVTDARDKAEKEGKKVEKKALSKDALMAKTRKGMKGKPGKPNMKTGAVVGKENVPSAGMKLQGTKRKREEKGDTKASFPQGEEGRLARRQQIIAKKRSMRRARKKGGA
ncbi:MAG: RNA recognition motif-containing protein [Claussenomyces sp. TS43310]|nr:MAG: RNA recognition motif-containing protein [Claussenomyces sp. TS43310]